jgi:preprotein translocase subunit SecG
MAFIIGLLTFIMVLDCLVLIFLVLIQLPKKEAGAGLAFGGAATDALFGAGSGTVLTKVTKYAAGIFFAMAFILAIMQSRFQGRRTTDFERMLEKQPAATAPAAPAPSTPAATATPAGTNLLLSSPAEATNAPATGTNAPAPK